MATDQNNDIESSLRAHEQSDANAKWIFGCVVILGLIILGVHFILAGWLNSLNHSPAPTDRWRPMRARAVPIQQFPRLQIAAPAELDAFRAREQAQLTTYDWINKTAGIVRVPIDVAMDLILKEGLPARKTDDQSQLGPSNYQLIRQRAEDRQPEIQGDQ